MIINGFKWASMYPEAALKQDRDSRNGSSCPDMDGCINASLEPAWKYQINSD
jgi:hypothetical protein